MKNLFVFGISFLAVAGMTSLALAANATPTPGSSTVSNAGAVSHNINFRFRQDMMQVQKDLHTGKLTQAQATSLQGQIKAIRKQELADYKTNGNKQLTAAQTSSLEQSLGQIEMQI